MKKLLLLLFIVCVLIIQACISTSCPDDEKIGEISISKKSLGFFPYKGNPVLVFKDQDGKELKFISKEGVKTNKEKLSVYKICSEFKFDGRTTYKYFEGQNKYIGCFSEPRGYSYTFSLFTNLLRKEQELFYDKLLIDISSIGTIGRGEIITDIRFDKPYKPEELNYNRPMVFLDSFTINDRTYYDIYATESFPEGRVFYNKEKGVVGFMTDSKTYNLVE